MVFQEPEEYSPFLLVAHHRHSFYALDPFRHIFRSLFLPEGFPAHPHRGFETVTYVLRGGLVHRDSFGVKKEYGAPPGSDGSGADAAVQWMTAGRGLNHEEMWRTGGFGESSEQELFQIWVNLPAAAKMVRPRMQMLRPRSSSPDASEGSSERIEVKELGPVPHVAPAPGVDVRVVAGTAAGVQSPVATYSDVAMLHVTLAHGASWSWPRPAGWTCIVYARRGEVAIGRPGSLLPVYHTARLSLSAHEDEVILQGFGENGADVLVLAGAPLLEPVEMGGNFVMNTPQELQSAKRDYSAGAFGPAWPHTLDDEDWRKKVETHWYHFQALKDLRR